jgi:hypothetical protein
VVRRRGPGAALVCALASACAAPSYPRDSVEGEQGGDAAAARAPDGGSTSVDAASEPELDAALGADAAPPRSDASLPAWAAPLLGRYAARTYAFAQDSLGAYTRVREFVMIDIVQPPSGDLELALRLCDSFVEARVSDLRVLHPSYATVRRHRVLLGDQTWSTEAPAAVDGYTRELPARCNGKPDQLVPKDPAQTWIEGDQCRCPASVDTPPLLGDCRLLDSDRDDAPGVTVHFHPRVPGLLDADVYVTVLNQSRFVNGTVRADRRHRAQLAVDQRATQLRCSVEPCLDISAPPTHCAPDRSLAEFVYLGEVDDASLDCDSVIARSGELFPTALPMDPASCL